MFSSSIGVRLYLRVQTDQLGRTAKINSDKIIESFIENIEKHPQIYRRKERTNASLQRPKQPEGAVYHDK